MAADRAGVNSIRRSAWGKRLCCGCSYLYLHLHLHLYLYLYLLLLDPVEGSAEDILGCGGFVKSDISINFSLVEIKLYTKQGTLKYRTDCAPNNGYYLIPLYDRGDYILKVDPPEGWSFEPSSVPLHVDGKSDLCSQGKDINFFFRGFSVTGQVVSAGSDDGPEGVVVSMRMNKDIVRKTTTGLGGNYKFQQVLPGEYQVTASHPKWRIGVSQMKLEVTKDNGSGGQSLTVAGYDVRGHVTSDGEPIQGVHFLLFSSRQPAPVVEDCHKTVLPGFQDVDRKSPLCYISSLQDGSFTFPSLPPGDYVVVPFYHGDSIRFDVKPAELAFTVGHGSSILSQQFQVQGFSVSGRVVVSAGAAGVAQARIMLQGDQVAVTRDDGTFTLESMKAGLYTLHVIADNIRFEPASVTVTPSTPQLPEIVATEFQVCGRLEVHQLPQGFDLQARRSVVISPVSAAATGSTSTRTDEWGRFCAWVRRGTYNVRPVVSQSESEVGLHFRPSVTVVDVLEGPVLQVAFEQFLAQIRGRVSCFGSCATLKVTLHSVGQGDGNWPVLGSASLKPDGKYALEGVLPGKYIVKVQERDGWCWKEDDGRQQILVVDEDIAGLDFHQSGYVLATHAMHDTVLHVTTLDKSFSNVLVVKTGKGRLCLEKPGVYEIHPAGCHEFAEKKFTFDTANANLELQLMPIRYLMAGAIVSLRNISDIKVSIHAMLKGAMQSEETIVGPLQAIKVSPSKEFRYNFSLWAQPGSRLVMKPMSASLLFYPPSIRLLTTNECMLTAAEFEGKEGLFMTGRVVPPLAGVRITIIGSGQVVEPVVVETDAAGKYSAGPLHSGSHYNVSAERVGYVLKKRESAVGDFDALKLAQIIAEVTTGDGQPLAGVLLSLSGGLDYRQNSITQPSGVMHFSNLHPGQYFLRPMLKEFTFDPVSTMIDVAQGAVIHQKLRGIRVAFSCFGTVTSLTGEPESGVVVESVGQNDSCIEYQEESVSDVEGTFRIRGLQPDCSYLVRLKSGPEVNQHIERSTPPAKLVQVARDDISQIHLIVFRHFGRMDASAAVITSRKFLDTLKVRLFRDDDVDQVLHTLSLGPTGFVQLPPLPLDDRTYTLRLESSLSRSSFEYELPHAVLRANKSYHHARLVFEPRPQIADQELHQGSFLALPLAAVAVAVALCHRQLRPLLLQLLVLFNSSRTSSDTVSNTEAVGEKRKKLRTRRIN